MRTRIVVLLALLLATANYASGDSTAPAKFFICSGNLDAYQLIPAHETYPETLEVKLSADGATEFQDFTRMNLGQTVRIFVDQKLMLETQVRAVIDSGRLVVTTRDGADTTALVENLRSAPSDPCGPAV